MKRTGGSLIWLLTDKGHILLEEAKLKVKENTKNRLATLTSEELAQMSLLWKH